MGAPKWPPNPQTFEAARHSRAASLSARISVDHGGPDMAPQPPQRSARPGPAVTRLDHALLDGPRNGPQTPKRSKRRGTAGPLLCPRALQLDLGGPTWPPNPQTFEAARHSRAASLSARTSMGPRNGPLGERGGPRRAPHTPQRSGHPGEPGAPRDPRGGAR